MSQVSTEQIKNSLKQCMDPEVPLSIVDMGLIYGINVSENNDVNIKMTMTTKGCPLHDTMVCLLYTSPSPRDISGSRMPSSA